jgi:thiamine pyrophosphate-dependent acetolactate synthase large subunit-like protein
MTVSTEPSSLDRPTGLAERRQIAWGSDAIAHALRGLGIPYVALNPGSSYRGLHDSVVNYLGNSDPQILLCLHEEHAVAIAHGYAKVTERPMAVALHSNVGLMHASMAIFDAFCDRVPVLLIGATGPLDATARRPWIDWLHTSADQAAIVRPYIKWDDQPGSVAAAADAVVRAHMLATTQPCAPTYVCLDVALQEQRLEAPIGTPSVARFGVPPLPAHPDPTLVHELATLLANATRPVILVGRVSRSQVGWSERVELAERVSAQVFTHVELPAGFPTEHPLSGGMSPAVHPSPQLISALDEADLVLSLDWLDLGGTLRAGGRTPSTVVSVSVDQHLHNGWTKDHQAPAPADLRIVADPDATVRSLLENQLRGATRHEVATISRRSPRDPKTIPPIPHGPLGIAHIAAALRTAVEDLPTTLVRVPSAWSGDLWEAREPLDILGGDGGGGLGSAPGMAVGVALALNGTGRLALTIMGDGDFLMGATAIWTAVRYRLPLLIVVMNNRSFLNDEMHQHQTADVRGRPAQNRWIGQRIDDPAPDLAGLARAQGARGYGPVTEIDELIVTIQNAVAQARDGATVVVDVWTGPEPASPAEGPWLKRPD